MLEYLLIAAVGLAGIFGFLYKKEQIKNLVVKHKSKLAKATANTNMEKAKREEVVRKDKVEEDIDQYASGNYDPDESIVDYDKYKDK
jgi:hypothetical protein